jgi:hypothetical protein
MPKKSPLIFPWGPGQAAADAVAEEVVELVDPLYVAMVEAVPWRSGYGHAVGFAGKGYPLVNVYITMENHLA